MHQNPPGQEKAMSFLCKTRALPQRRAQGTSRETGRGRGAVQCDLQRRWLVAGEPKMQASMLLLGALAAMPTTCGFVAYQRATLSKMETRSRHALVMRQQAQEQERPKERQFISILAEDGTEQMLPTASASQFPLWVIDVDDTGRKEVVRVPGASTGAGWVDPTSYSELWIPEGSPAPQMTLSLGMLVKDGVPRYVMPMVDLFVLKDGQKWRNRGLNSVPTAHCWESVGRAAAGVLTVSAYAEEEVEGSMTDSMWGALAEKIPISEAFTDIVSVLADPPEEMQLESGFNFLVAEVAGPGTLRVPSCGGRVRVFLSDLPAPADLLELVDVVGVAELGFDVVSVASGRDSEYLPKVYREFFAPEASS